MVESMKLERIIIKRNNYELIGESWEITTIMTSSTNTNAGEFKLGEILHVCDQVQRYNFFLNN